MPSVAARATQERALAIEEAAYGPDHPQVAIILGNVQEQLGDLDAARAAPGTRPGHQRDNAAPGYRRLTPCLQRTWGGLLDEAFSR